MFSCSWDVLLSREAGRLLKVDAIAMLKNFESFHFDSFLLDSKNQRAITFECSTPNKAAESSSDLKFLRGPELRSWKMVGEV